MFTACTWFSPLFRGNLAQRNLKIANLFYTSFDKSVNHKWQEEQMNVLIRFWDENLSEVQTYYLNSKLLNWQNAGNMLYELLEATDTLPQKSMIMLSMDGPNTIWTFYEALKSHCTEKEFPKLLMLVHVDYMWCMDPFRLA